MEKRRNLRMPIKVETKTTIEKSQHRRIAENRGEKWLKNVAEGRIKAILNPSIISIYRRHKRLLQSNMAKQLGFTEGKYQSIERGRVPVSAATAKKIADILGGNWQKMFKFVKYDKYVAILSKTEI